MFINSKKTSVHFVGIGGIGMSGIAEVLKNLGYEVSGSDIAKGPNIERLIEIGCQIFIGHDQDNIEEQDVVVVSSAIDVENPEVSKAIELGIPIIKRAEMLSELMRQKLGIAIAGTHGKTTTTSILSTIMSYGEFDPTYIIGGIVKNLGGHAKIGQGQFLVAEADESDASFLLLAPVISVITNIDDDHMETYETSEKLDKAFERFANKVPFYGFNILNFNDERVRKLSREIKKPYISISTNNSNADYFATDISTSWSGSEFAVVHKNEKYSGFKLSVPGDHNIQNALCAVAVAHELEMDMGQIKEGLSYFQRVGRRFEQLFENESICILDDYAHHPTEVVATLKALKECTDKKITAFFEPHRFSRTRDCWQDFLHSFNYADEVKVLPIYPASEEPIEGITAQRLVSDINKLHPNFASTATYESMKEDLSAQEGVVITLGAGSIGRKIRELVNEF